jgi:hypothetical protein
MKWEIGTNGIVFTLSRLTRPPAIAREWFMGSYRLGKVWKQNTKVKIFSSLEKAKKVCEKLNKGIDKSQTFDRVSY